ncbi:hypothetical protein OUZ56_002784 [Daphnia magna]|uniref:Uncharacterized protein n=1 Tax=Daphnia magna TaxID=35525 RepID=A0ABR0A6S4_9CRUS|nr:hypothetical protein OUZ56_002784 [Daphnia magna]
MTESGLRKGEEERIRIASPFCCTLKDVFGTCRVCTIGQVEEERKAQVQVVAPGQDLHLDPRNTITSARCQLTYIFFEDDDCENARAAPALFFFYLPFGYHRLSYRCPHSYAENTKQSFE